MADPTTPNYGLTKPAVNDPAGADTWGAKLNTNFDLIDTAIQNSTSLFLLGLPKVLPTTPNTIWNNNGVINITPAATVPPPVTGVQIYVDSVAGLNTNDGLSTTTPKQNISAIPFANNITINLKRGSKFREWLSVEAYSGITVTAYGSGQLPVLDCSDVIPAGGWTQPNAGTYPNVWQITVNSGAALAGMFSNIWIDNARPKYVASLALVNSTPGSFTTADGSAGGQYGATTTTFQIYSTTNPNTNGSVYEWAARPYGFSGANAVKVSNIHTRRNAHNNGSLVAGTGATVTGCVMEDGAKHNCYVSPGSVMTNCVAWKSDWMVPERQGWTGFVSHSSTLSGVETTTFIGCQVIADIAVFNAYAGTGGMTGFYAHTNGGTGNNWGRLSYTDCSVMYCRSGFDAANCLGADHVRSHVKGCYYGISCPDGSGAAVNTVTDCWLEESDSIVMQRGVLPAGSSTTIDGLRVCIADGGNDGMIYGGMTSGVTVKRSAFARTTASAGYMQFIRNESSSGVHINGNVLWGPNTGYGEQLYLMGTGVLDHNAYGGSNSDFTINGISAKTAAYLTAAQAAGSEAGSVSITSNPFTNPAAGDFTLTGGSGLSSGTYGCARFPTYQTILTGTAIAAM